MSANASSSPIVAIIAAGAMGAGVAKRMTESGCRVWTILEGRSEATRKRAQEAGMKESSVQEIAKEADFVLSILPPSDAYELAKTFAKEFEANGGRRVVYADCNAVSPETVKKISGVFAGLKDVGFVDASIIGGPPKGSYNPRFYAAVAAGDEGLLGEFEKLRVWGIDVKPLRGEGVGVGDASALKMSYAGLSKGLTGLFATMILAAHASSPGTSEALLEELSYSQPMFVERIKTHIPAMLPKAYRWVGEMEEIAEFVNRPEGDIYRGLARIFERMSLDAEGESGTLLGFVSAAKLKGSERA